MLTVLSSHLLRIVTFATACMPQSVPPIVFS